MKRKGLFLLIEFDTQNCSFGFDIYSTVIGIRLWFVGIHLCFVPVTTWLDAVRSEQATSEWKPIDDDTPLGTPLLLKTKDGVLFLGCWYDGAWIDGSTGKAIEDELVEFAVLNDKANLLIERNKE